MATEADNVNSGALGTLLTVGAFATLGIAFVVTALVRSEMSEEAEKKDVSADRPLRDLLNEQRAKLDAPAAFIDKTKGVVSLPIDRAMELTVEGLKKDPNSATPPAPAGAGGGGAAQTAAAGGGGAGGSAGAGAGTTNPAPAEAPQGTVGAEKPAEEPKDKAAGDAKKKAPKKAPTPALPAPAAPPPAPAAPAAPNGQ